MRLVTEVRPSRDSYIDSIQDTPYVVLSRQDACEFTSKKDYTDNWCSEMHERFCFWSFSQWKQAVGEAGFRLSAGSRPISNPWIVENRYRGKAEFYRAAAGQLEAIDYPPTNMILIAERV